MTYEDTVHINKTEGLNVKVINISESCIVLMRKDYYKYSSAWIQVFNTRNVLDYLEVFNLWTTKKII